MSKTLKTAIPFIILVVFAGTSIAPLLSTNSMKSLINFSGTAILSNTGDQTQTGTAERVYEDNTYTITLSANLKDPTEGSHYEGWIVRLSPFKTTSIGQLSKNTDGTWIASYSEQNPQTDYETFTTVIVTEEIGTGTPEIPNSTHALEGTF
ncbi:MAG: hypothetical protein WCT46_04365 [Candidatus Gracilibacteria bacterium]|jgi:hypothetical protein